jgi:hypothetical protein
VVVGRLVRRRPQQHSRCGGFHTLITKPNLTPDLYIEKTYPCGESLDSPGAEAGAASISFPLVVYINPNDAYLISLLNPTHWLCKKKSPPATRIGYLVFFGHMWAGIGQPFRIK